MFHLLSSLGPASRLYVLQGAIAQQEWRLPYVLNSLLAYLEPLLSHPYKNVRDRLGRLAASLLGTTTIVFIIPI